MTLTDWKEKALRAANYAKNLKAEAAKPLERTVDQLLVGSGALTVGVLRALLGDPEKDAGAAYIPGTEVEADVVLGFLASGIGVSGIVGDKYAAGFNVFSAGIAAPV
ncbi:MAG: hypothetical protein P8Y27_04930, partial [Chromatiaceae bacterium]